MNFCARKCLFWPRRRGCSPAESPPTHRGITCRHSYRELQEHVAAIEGHNKTLREKADAIPTAARGSLSVDEFCALPPKPNIDADIDAAQKALAAATEQEPIRMASSFETLALPLIDLAELGELLSRDLPELDSTAAARVQAHLISIGPREPSVGFRGHLPH